MNKIILDVRSKEEFDEKHVENATNLPLIELSEGNLGLLKDLPKDTEISVYCRSGARSSMAKEILEKEGFTHITNLGGIDNIL